MNLDKYFEPIKRIFTKYVNLISYSVMIIILAIVGYFVYVNVYKTAIAPDPIAESEIIAKKQKVNVGQFKAIEEKIETKNQGSTTQVKDLF